MKGRIKHLFRVEAHATVQGVLRMGQEIEVRPGIVSKDAEGRAACLPIYSRIVSLFTEQNELQFAVPGGLIGVGTTVCLRGILVICLCTVNRSYPPLYVSGLTRVHHPRTVTGLGR